MMLSSDLRRFLIILAASIAIVLSLSVLGKAQSGSAGNAASIQTCQSRLAKTLADLNAKDFQIETRDTEIKTKEALIAKHELLKQSLLEAIVEYSAIADSDKKKKSGAAANVLNIIKQIAQIALSPEVVRAATIIILSKQFKQR